MANSTIKGAKSIHGTNPQYLIEKVIRSRIYDSTYWKESCFALNAASLIDHAVKVKYIGGTYANQKPTDWMCLVLKLLQLQPGREIVMEYLRADEFKYLRALAAFYIRLTFPSIHVYETLEPLLSDYRKLRLRTLSGAYVLTTIDQFADDLLNEERVCEVQLPRLALRKTLEEVEGLTKRKSKLASAMGLDSDAEEEEDEEGEGESRKERYISRSPSLRSGSSDAERSGRRSPRRERERYISRSPSPGGDSQEEGGRYLSRSPSPGSDAAGGERYVSRSPSVDSVAGAGAMEIDEDERIEGDV